MSHDVPPAAEVFPLKTIELRHPELLQENRLRWAWRNRKSNGLLSCGAAIESPVGEILFHEPSLLRWLFGLAGRAKPRSTRRSKRRAA